jgi:hypothetical protein
MHWMSNTVILAIAIAITIGVLWLAAKLILNKVIPPHGSP